MGAKIDFPDLGLDRLFRSAHGPLQKELVDYLQDTGRQTVTKAKASAFIKIQRKAASTLTVDKESDGVRLSGGKGTGLGAVLFAGGEFGGRATKKKNVRVSLWGRPPVWLRKRTTMMFLPHLGAEGYFFWPEVRDWLGKIEDDAAEIVEKAIR